MHTYACTHARVHAYGGTLASHNCVHMGETGFDISREISVHIMSKWTSILLTVHKDRGVK